MGKAQLRLHGAASQFIPQRTLIEDEIERLIAVLDALDRASLCDGEAEPDADSEPQGDDEPEPHEEGWL